MVIKSGNLNNKIKYIINNNNNYSSTTILIMFKTGSRNELPKYYGISHFIEHLMFKGTKKRPKAETIVNELYRYGAKINAFTDIDNTGYYVKIPSEHLDNAIDILSDMLFNSKFREKDIKLEKKIVLNELERSNSNPDKQLYCINNKILYHNTCLEHNIGGVKEDIEKYTRNMIMSYLTNHYRLDNMVISIAGKADKEIVNKLNKSFGNKVFNYKTRKNLINSNKIIYYPNFRNMQNGIRFNNIIRKSLQQSYVAISVPTYSINDKRSYIVDIIGTMLAGNMGSRLFLKLREKLGLVYTVTKNIDKYEDLGALKIIFSTFNGKDNIRKCYQIVIEEFNKLKNNKVTKGELQRTKDYIIGKTKLEKEDTFNMAYFYAINQLFMGKPYSYDHNIKNYEKVTINNVYEIANDIFDINKINLSIISKNELI